jgi:glycosyltransferase involved in cell wall biosynthesis
VLLSTIPERKLLANRHPSEPNNTQSCPIEWFTISRSGRYTLITEVYRLGANVSRKPSQGGAHSHLGAIEMSVVIPCLNEANSLAICIEKALLAFHQMGIKGEVVVADNGSTDGSIEIAETHGARVVLVAAKGYGNALRAGIEAAQGAFIVIGDADDSYDFSELPKFVAKWREGSDLVMGNRLRGQIKPGAMPWHHRYIGTPVMSSILNMFFRAGIGDVNCGMRGFTKDLYKRLDLRTTGMEFASEFAIKTARSGARITEIPITLWPDKRGRPPHLRSFHDGWRHLRFMLLYAPNWLFLLPGGILALFGTFLVIWLLPGPRELGHAVIDVHTMLFGMVFALTGTQIIAIGMFAKVYSYAERLAPKQRSLERWLRRVKLEEGLALGTMFSLIGGGGLAWVGFQWVRRDFGPLNEFRLAIFFSLWFLLGIQIIFSSFFLSMLGISRGTYIGDYDSK